MKQWFSEEGTVEKNCMKTRKRRIAVMGMSRPMIQLWKLPSAKRMFTSVEEGWF